jgi:hypothetical protein
MIKGQIIKVVSTGTRYRLDRIEKQREGNAYQFYPIAPEKESFPRGEVMPFNMHEKHFNQLVNKLIIHIEPIENGSARKNIGKSA